MAGPYDEKFYAWVNFTARRSAEAFVPLAFELCRPKSVVDVGCGEGAWLSVWRELGVQDLLGLDGEHVCQDRVMLQAGEFVATDLSEPFPVKRRFDLAQSLEVGEHLPLAAAGGFVAGLCALSDIVVFSAATPGQGGEMHVNEQEPSWWAALFAKRGYAAFDALRPQLLQASGVAPWYRFNSVVYANVSGQANLSPAALTTRCDDIARLDGVGDALWRLRRRVLARLPTDTVTRLSRLRYRVAMALGGTA